MTAAGRPRPSPSPLRLLGSLLALGLLVYLLSRQGWAEILAAVRRIPWPILALALVLILASRLAVAARWGSLLRGADERMPGAQIVRLTFAGLFASNFLPTTVGGDLVRLAGALQTEVDRAAGAASIAVDRLVGMAGMASALPLGLVPLIDWLGAGGLTTEARGIWLLAFPPPPGRARRLAGRLRQGAVRLRDALALWIRRPRSLLSAFAFTWLHMLCKYAAIWLLFSGMGDRIAFWKVTGLWSFTYFITLFPLSINGLGVQEISMAYIYEHLGGAAPDNALVAALLVRTLELAASLPGALFLPETVSGRRG